MKEKKKLGELGEKSRTKDKNGWSMSEGEKKQSPSVAIYC